MYAVWSVLLLAGLCAADRLENTYLPPSSASSAGGSGLAPPFQSPPQNSYLPPRNNPPPQNSYLPPRNNPPPQTSYVPPRPAPPPRRPSNPSPNPSRPINSYLPPQITSFTTASPAPPSSPSNSYLPPSSSGYSSDGGYSSSGSGSYSSSGSFSSSGSQARPVAIIKQINENNGDGTYTFSYETENGIQAQERGQLRPDGAEGIESVEGSFSYTGPDNVRYSVQYTADENGFLAYGDHLPTPPPVPAEIQRAIEQNLADEARGISDDGQYRGEGASGGYPSGPSGGGYQY